MKDGQDIFTLGAGCPHASSPGCLSSPSFIPAVPHSTRPLRAAHHVPSLLPHLLSLSRVSRDPRRASGYQEADRRLLRQYCPFHCRDPPWTAAGPVPCCPRLSLLCPWPVSPGSRVAGSEQEGTSEIKKCNLPSRARIPSGASDGGSPGFC